MVQVRIWGSLAAAADDQTEVEIEASNLRELLDGLAAAYPAMRPQLDRGISVAIDGRVYNDSWFTPIRGRQRGGSVGAAKGRLAGLYWSRFQVSNGHGILHCLQAGRIGASL